MWAELGQPWGVVEVRSGACGARTIWRTVFNIATTGGEVFGLRLEHVHEIQDRDDRDRDADGPRKYAFHWGAPVIVAGATRVGVGRFHMGLEQGSA